MVSKYVIVVQVLIKNLNIENLGRNPFGLVLAPTRELAQQIHTVARQFPSLRPVCLYGGSDRGAQMRELQRNPKILIATPGRLNDLVDSNAVSLSDIEYLVLDEADRMLDMGFEPQIRGLIEATPRERQTLMWSATWPEEVQELATDFLDDFIQINCGSAKLHANPSIKQKIIVVHDEDKRSKLIEVIQDEIKTREGTAKTLVFSQTKRSVDYITMFLRRQGIRAEGIHGDKSQRFRDDTLRGIFHKIL